MFLYESYVLSIYILYLIFPVYRSIFHILWISDYLFIFLMSARVISFELINSKIIYCSLIVTLFLAHHYSFDIYLVTLHFTSELVHIQGLDRGKTFPPT